MSVSHSGVAETGHQREVLFEVLHLLFHFTRHLLRHGGLRWTSWGKRSCYVYWFIVTNLLEKVRAQTQKQAKLVAIVSGFFWKFGSTFEFICSFCIFFHENYVNIFFVHKPFILDWCNFVFVPVFSSLYSRRHKLPTSDSTKSGSTLL